MPTITLVAAPHPGSTTYDPPTDTTFALGVPTFTDDPTIWERLQSVESFGYRFAVVDNEVTADGSPAAAQNAGVDPAPPADSAGNQTAEQAADTPTAQES